MLPDCFYYFDFVPVRAFTLALYDIFITGNYVRRVDRLTFHSITYSTYSEHDDTFANCVNEIGRESQQIVHLIKIGNKPLYINNLNRKTNEI